MKDFANLLLDEFMSATSNNGSGGAAFIVAVAAERPSLWADADLLILDVVIWWRWSPAKQGSLLVVVTISTGDRSGREG